MGSIDVPKFVRDRMKEQIQNGKKPSESNVPSFVKKKDEADSEDGAASSQATLEPSPSGIGTTPQSQSQLPSENGAATPTFDFREGLQFQQPQQSKKPAIFSIAELARKQNNDDNIILASVIPKTFPENQPNNIVEENIKNSKEKDVLAGNPDAITSVIQREQQNLEKQKNQAKNNLSGIQKAQGYGAQGEGYYGRSVELETEIQSLRATQTKLLNDGIETINKVYAKKYEDSPDKSVVVQNALGNELRSQQAKIGGDLLYTDEKSIADRLPDFEKVMTAPGATFSPIKNVLQQRFDLVKKTNQQLEFTNRATLLNAAYENSFEQLQDLSKDPQVQQGLSGTSEQQAELADNPKVVQAKKLMDDFKSTGAQMDNLVNQYPEVKAQRQSQQVADLYADYIVRAEKGEFGTLEKLLAGRNLVEGKRLNDDYEIKRIVDASNGTLTEDEVRKYADNASIPSFVGNFLRGFGTSFKDTEQGLNRLLMPKSEADINNTLIEQSKYHAPEALQGYSNVNNIVSTMFSGTGNIVGLGVQGLAGGEIIGAVSGLSKLARLSKTALNALQTAEQVLPATKLADFMVTLGAAETKEQALAQLLGAASKAKNMAGVYGSIYLPTYEGAYQEAARFTSDEDKRNEYAGDVANANGVAMLFLNPPSLVGKIIKPVPFGTKEVFQSQLAHVGKTLVSAAPATMIPFVQETISKDDIFDYHTSASTFINEALDRTLSMAVSILPLGILGAARMPASKVLKSSLYEAGKQRENLTAQVEDMFNKGELTNEQKNGNISIVNTLSNLVRETPEKNNEGKDLTQEQKNDLVYLQMQNAALRAKQEKVTEDIKPHYEQEIKENSAAIKEIMQPKEEKPVEEIKTQEPEDNITVGDMVDKKGSYNGERGIFYQDGQTVVFKVEGQPKEYELGNVEEVKNTPIKDFGITHEESVVGANDTGEITVRGEVYKNNFSDPVSAINYDKEGNVVSVNLETSNGDKRTFRGNIAEDLAYQINLKEISKDNETRDAFEQHLNQDAEAQKEMESESIPEVAEVEATSNNEVVSREKIERIEQQGLAPEEPVTKPITINVSEEKSSQSGEESRQESGQTRGEGNEENVGSQPIAENQGGAAGSGGPPLTSNEFMEVSGEETGPQRRFTQQMLRSDELSEAAKGEIAKTLDYTRQTNEVSLKQANDVIDTVGLSEAQNFVMNDGDLKPAVRVTLSQILIKKYSELASKSEDENTRNYYLDKAIQTASFVTEKLGTEAGQSIQAFSMWSRLSPEGQLRAANQDMARQGREKLRRREKDINVIGDKFKKANEDAAEEITNSPKLKEAVKKEDSKRVAKAKDKIAAAKIKREEIIKKYKGEKGKGLYSSPTGLTKEGIEFVGDLVATYVQEGIANLEIIVDKVLTHLKEVSGKATNDEVRKNVSDIASEAIGKKEDKAIAGGLSELESEIGKIVREHYTVAAEAKTSLIDKFIQKAGLEKPEAEKLAKDIADEFDRIATRKKRDILYNEKARFDKINNTLSGAKKPEPKTVQSDIIKYSNLGAFEQKEFSDLMASKFGLGEISPEQAGKLLELANKVQNAPEGSPKNNATEDLLNYRAKLRGNDLGETAQAVWYSNVLSGYKTHEKNLVSTFFNSMAELGAEMLKDPKGIPYILAGYAKGLITRGRVEAAHTLKTGRSPIHIKKIETPNVLERKGFMGGGYNPANWFKYIMRLMVAEDVLSFQGLKEARSYQLARREAQNEGYNTWSKKGWDRVNEILLHTKERMKEADDQATAEGMKGLEKKRRVYELMENSRPTAMTEDAYGFAAHGTFNHESEGSLGAITNVVASAMDAVSVGGVKPLRFIVPFTRIITNVVNNSLDFTPVGFIRGARGVRGFRSFEGNRFTKGAFKELDKGERQRLIAKAAIGVSLTTALQALHQAGVIQITGAGPSDQKKKQQLMGEGWQPYSIKVGDKYYSYQYTPMVFMTGFLGNMNDASKYEDNGEQDMLKRVQIAGSRIGGQIVDMTWINSASTFLGALAEPNPNTQSKQLSNVFGNTIKGFVPFSGAMTQTSQLIQNEFNMPQKQVNGAWQALIQDIPIARNSLNDKINALGDPVVRDNDVVLSAETKDPVWKYLLDHNGWVAPVNKNTIIVFDPELKMDRPVTNDEYYEFSKLRGQKIKEGIKNIMANGATVVNPKEAVTKTADELTEGELNILLTDIEGDATKAAKKELFQPKEKKRTKIFVNPKSR